MVIKGTINGGEKFIRQSHNAIINLIPEPPRVKMVASQPGYLHSPATIACSVKESFHIDDCCHLHLCFFGKSKYENHAINWN